MSKVLFATTLLFIFVSVSCPLHAQKKVGTVEFRLCNAGKVDVDVFLSRSGKVSSAHVGPADCKSVAKTIGPMEPGYIGLAFADSHGQWGAAHRLDLLPNWGTLPQGSVAGAALELLGVRGASPRPASEPQYQLSRANQTASVQHGNVTVSLSMPLLFRPSTPICRTVGGDSTAAQDYLPINATPIQRAQAESSDRAIGAETVCDELVYTLNVEAFADTHEITFKQECDPCDKKTEVQLTPEQRAARQRRADAVDQVIATTSGLGPLGAIFGNVVDQGRRDAAREAKERAARVKPPQPVNWDDLLLAMKMTPASGGLPLEIPRNIMVRGTVSRIEEAPANAAEHWVDIYVKESPDGMFDVCALEPDIFQDAFGANFRTAMIGKPVEVEGQLQRSSCKGFKGSIRVTLAHQARVVASALFDPAVVPRIVRPIDQPTSRPPELPKDPSDYTGIRTYLLEQVRPEGPAAYRISENRAKLEIIDHCLAMKDLSYLGTMLTNDEVAKLRTQAGQAEVKANVNGCISEYDPKEIVANRKAAMEYCFQLNNSPTNRQLMRPPAGFPACLDQHDMLQAMCKQQLELRVAYSMRNYPGQPRPPQTCGVPRLATNELAMLADASSPATMAALPAKFTAPPPDVSIAAVAPPTPIAAGTVLHTSLQLGLNAISVDRNQIAQARLDEPLSVGGQVLFTVGTIVFLKSRVIGPGPRPGTIQIGLSTDWAMAQPDNHKVQLTSDELVFTLARQPPAGAGVDLVIPPGTKLTFTTPTAPAAVVSRPTAAAAGAPSPASVQQPVDRPQTAASAPQRGPKIAACRQQAAKDHPRGGVDFQKEYTDCIQGK